MCSWSPELVSIASQWLLGPPINWCQQPQPKLIDPDRVSPQFSNASYFQTPIPSNHHPIFQLSNYSLYSRRFHTNFEVRTLRHV